MLLPPMHYSKISRLLQYSVSIQKLVPVRAEKSYHILNFLLQTSINVSDNSITIVLQ